MKFVRRIGLFLALTGLMFGAGSYLTLKAEHFFYPNRYEINRSESKRQDIYESEPTENAGDITPAGIGEKSGNVNVFGDSHGETTENEQVIEAIVEDDPVVTSDTIYLVEEVNLSDGTVTEKEEPVPDKYIGLDRESLIMELASYENTPALKDLQRGFTSIELTVFSKERIVVCKYYGDTKEEQGYYLMVADHFVVVYEQDGKTLYMNTDILLENLEESLQDEIIKGKYIEDEQSLYNFLESYSS